MCTHTTAEHEAFKAPGIWESLDFVGHQPGDDEHGDLEMRNADCGSTICRRCLLTPAQRDEVRAAARVRSESFRSQVAAARARTAEVRA